MIRTEQLSWSLESITANVETVMREEREADIRLHNLVNQAREDGGTWQQIADSLGTSKQAAHERFRS